MKTVVMVDGGIGRILCATPAIEELAKTQEVIVVTSWTDIFENNPHVERVYKLDFPYLFDDVIKGNILKNPEPYQYPPYYNDNLHLMQAFNELLEVNPEKNVPQIHLTESEKVGGENTVKSLRKEHKKPVICFQPFAATHSPEFGSDDSRRSLKMDLIAPLLTQLDAVFVNFGIVPIEHPNVVNLKLPLRKFMAIAAFCDYCIGIDSSLAHIAAAFGRVGTFFYGPTNPEQLGYERFNNIARTGYPKGHQSFRLPTNPMLNEGAMDFTTKEREDSLQVIRDHLEKCVKG